VARLWGKVVVLLLPFHRADHLLLLPFHLVNLLLLLLLLLLQHQLSSLQQRRRLMLHVSTVHMCRHAASQQSVADSVKWNKWIRLMWGQDLISDSFEQSDQRQSCMATHTVWPVQMLHDWDYTRRQTDRQAGRHTDSMHNGYIDTCTGCLSGLQLSLWQGLQIHARTTFSSIRSWLLSSIDTVQICQPHMTVKKTEINWLSYLNMLVALSKSLPAVKLFLHTCTLVRIIIEILRYSFCININIPVKILEYFQFQVYLNYLSFLSPVQQRAPLSSILTVAVDGRRKLWPQ